jgi:hypothetical protein
VYSFHCFPVKIYWRFGEKKKAARYFKNRVKKRIGREGDNRGRAENEKA